MESDENQSKPKKKWNKARQAASSARGHRRKAIQSGLLYASSVPVKAPEPEPGNDGEIGEDGLTALERRALEARAKSPAKFASELDTRFKGEDNMVVIYNTLMAEIERDRTKPLAELCSSYSPNKKETVTTNKFKRRPTVVLNYDPKVSNAEGAYHSKEYTQMLGQMKAHDMYVPPLPTMASTVKQVKEAMPGLAGSDARRIKSASAFRRRMSSRQRGILLPADTHESLMLIQSFGTAPPPPSLQAKLGFEEGAQGDVEGGGMGAPEDGSAGPAASEQEGRGVAEAERDVPAPDSPGGPVNPAIASTPPSPTPSSAPPSPAPGTARSPAPSPGPSPFKLVQPAMLVQAAARASPAVAPAPASPPASPSSPATASTAWGKFKAFKAVVSLEEQLMAGTAAAEASAAAGSTPPSGSPLAPSPPPPSDRARRPSSYSARAYRRQSTIERDPIRPRPPTGRNRRASVAKGLRKSMGTELAGELQVLDVRAEQDRTEAAFGAFSLGLCYEKGWGVRKDEKVAMSWYSEGVEHEDPAAMVALAKCCERGVGAAEGSAKVAVVWYRRAADLCHAAGELNLARCLEHGLGVPADLRAAYSYYVRASENTPPGDEEGEALEEHFSVFEHFVARDKDKDKGRPRGLPGALRPAPEAPGEAEPDLAVMDTRLMEQSLRWFKRADHDATNAEALYHVGRFHEKGLGGIQRDLQQAAQWYGRSAALRHPLGLTCYGRSLAQGWAGKRDPYRAVTYYKAAIKLDCRDAVVIMAHAHFHGEGCRLNMREAFNHYSLGAEMGCADAKACLGMMHMKGHWVKQDPPQGLAVLRQAAQQGSAQAQYQMGLCYQDGEHVVKDMALAAKWFERASDSGHVDASARLGLCYWHGQGVDRDVDKGFVLSRGAAEQGNIEGMKLVGKCYRWGRGGALDPHVAVKWFRQCADLGDAEGMNLLGECLEAGLGVTAPDPQQAAVFYKLSATAGYVDGMRNYGRALEGGMEGTRDVHRAAMWYHKAAELGDREAQYHTGRCFQEGWGHFDVDMREAMKWYRKAADEGHTGAQTCMGQIYEAGTAGTVDLALAMVWYQRAAEDGDAFAVYKLKMLDMERVHMSGKPESLKRAAGM